MSMLAERKSKTKWCLNPRGKEWSQDSNKFGQKLLEKMGWTSGKGLGKQENGVTEHVKVSLKTDSKGLGFKEDANPWTENEQSFGNLLQKLSENVENKESKKINSLEKKSESSRVRVHYRKFTRSKDISKYSAKDLASIFGRPVEEPNCDGYDNPALNISIDDHPEDGDGKANPGLELSLEDQDENTVPAIPPIKRSADDGAFENLGLDLSIEMEPIKKKKKRNLKKDNGVVNEGLDLSIEDVTLKPNKKRKRASEQQNTEIEVPGKKKSKKYVYVNSGLEISFDSEEIRKQPEEEKPKKHKKKKTKREEKETFKPKSVLKKHVAGEGETKRRRKSVQINESLNQEKIITDSEHSMNDSTNDSNLSLAIDNYQSTLDNSINEKKCEAAVDYTTHKFKHIALAAMQRKKATVVFPGIKHETIVRGYGQDV